MKLSIFIMILLTLVDQASKIAVREYVSRGDITVLLPNFLELTFVENKGVSFSFLSDLPDIIRLPLLIGVSLIAVVGMLYYLIRHWNELGIYSKWAFALIIPGAAGNLIDRAALGAVTDFLHFRFYEQSFFVNNLADCFISVGVVFFIIATFVEKQPHSEESSLQKSSPS